VAECPLEPNKFYKVLLIKKRMKRLYFALLILLFFVLSFSGHVRAEDWWQCSNGLGDGQEMFAISGVTNAHAEAWNENQYGTNAENGVEICFYRYFRGLYDDTSSDPHVGTGMNTILRLSGTTNAHVENITFTTPGYVNISYGNLDCFVADKTQDCDDAAGGDITYCLIGSLYGATNTHFSLEDDDERYALCCKAPGYGCWCDYDNICEDGETPANCPDCATTCGDGVIEGMEQCDCGDPTQWNPLNPLAHWNCGDGAGGELNGAMCIDIPGYFGGDLGCYPPGSTEGNGECWFNTTDCDEAQCADGSDNDNDGAADALDFSCWDNEGHYNASDNDETNLRPECNDNIDNDGDELNNYSATPGEGDSGCIDLQDNLEANCGDLHRNDPEECDGADWLYANCKEAGYKSGTLTCNTGTCLLNRDDCVGFQGFCIDNEPFFYWEGEIMVSPTSCQDYNLVYPGEQNASLRRELCINSCVEGANDAANNGAGGLPLLEGGCAWDDSPSAADGGECYFNYTTVDHGDTPCRLDYTVLKECTPDNPFRTVEVRGDSSPRDQPWRSSCACFSPTCTKEIRCPRVLQLPFIGNFGLALVVVIITAVYIYLNRKK